MPCNSSYLLQNRCRRLFRFRFWYVLFVVAFPRPIIRYILPPAAAAIVTNTGSDAGISEEKINRCDKEECEEDSNGNSIKDNIFHKDVVRQPIKRIVGGKDAPKNRYPYFVSLQGVYNGTHKCGGSLVAPDVVMTAAHCESDIKYAQVGRYYLTRNGNSTNDNDDMHNLEMFDVTGPMYPHPLYNSGVSFSHDVLLFKLNRKSKNQYIQINTDPNLPSMNSNSIGQEDARNSNYKDTISEHNYGNNLTVMGIGSTKFAKFGLSSPKVLQETTTSFVPNRVCRRSKDPDVDDNYQNLISDDMLCAFEDSQDACQGDSGGPLIYKGNSPSSDVLVGIVSWGFGCANPSFPGVYSRVSYYSEWAIATICQLSSEPPLEYDCANVMAPSQENSVPITVIIQFDDHPGEISWSIGRVESDTILVNVTEEINAVARSRSQETVFLPPGSDLTFTIRDRYGDGLCCTTPGNYRVVLGRNAIGKVLAYGGGDFGREESHSFQVPEDFVEEEETPLIEDGQIPLIIVIQLDNFPEEIGWRIDRLGIEIEDVIRIPAGIYTTPEMTIIRTIVLEKNELYYFNIYDILEDGIGSGYVRLFLGTLDVSDSSRMIFESDGNFQSGTDHTFLAAFPSTVSLPPSDDYMYLTLVMKTDLYPGEISMQLRMDGNDIQEDKSDTIVFFRPPNFYKDRVNEIVTERISIPQTSPEATRQFSFIIADRSGDGICCAWNGELDTGYILYKGDPSNNHVIVDSKFESMGREVKIFHVKGTRIAETNPSTEESEDPIIQIKVTVMLDAFPDETGFFIADSLGRRLFYVPPGTFTEQNGIVEKSFDLYAGLYTFNVIDTFGDGINREDSVYRIDFVGDNNRPSILSGSGEFMRANSQAFLLEGDRAQYPLQINMKSGRNPEEFGFSIYRLDRIETVPSVASRSKGEYKVAYADISEKLLVTKGGLYKIVFENPFSGVNGEIRINLGSSDPGLYKAIEYTFDTAETQDAQWWRLKFYAGEPLFLTGNDAKMLTLRVRSGHFSGGFEWILLSNKNKLASRYVHLDAQEGSEIIGYGPLALLNEMEENDVRDEIIMIPRPNDNQRYTMIVTGDDNFGAWLEEGTSLQLYDGQIRDESLISLDRLETGSRVVFSFSLFDSGSACFRSSMQSSYTLSSALTLLALIALH